MEYEYLGTTSSERTLEHYSFPPATISYRANTGGQTGLLSFKEGRWEFEGDASASALIFLDAMNVVFAAELERLVQLRLQAAVVNEAPANPDEAMDAVRMMCKGGL